ncbi:MAG: BrnT family toxin [Deltaproteobacteria bacterium]|nr:BrnT family toxin [Deltaproteobacteria bacterium]
MEIREFEWDDNNIEHIARHGVSPNEVEDLAFDDDPWIRKGRKGTRYMLGYTIAGRYLFVVYNLKGKWIARVITSMDMDEKTRRLYKKRIERGKK